MRALAGERRKVVELKDLFMMIVALIVIFIAN
jgi:hypothetical protein